MNTSSFLAALALMTCMNAFVYFSYPPQWRKNKTANAVLLLFHVLAALNLALIFAFYRVLPESVKPLISRAGAIFYVMDIFLAIFFGIRLILRFLKAKIAGKKDVPDRAMPFYRTDSGQAFLFVVVSLAIAVTGYFHITPLHRTEYEITVSKPADRESLKAVLIADLHAGAATWKETYVQLREMILEEEPDVLLIAGDVFDETTSETDVNEVRSVFEAVSPPLGKYYVYGNHDKGEDDWAAKTMRGMGVRVLEDEMTEIEGIQLIGRLDPKEKNTEIEELFETLPVHEEKPLIVLQHRPVQYRQLSEKGADIALSGHTHGFNIPQFLAVGPFNDMYYGMRKYGPMAAVVTSGVSAWGFHYKFPAESEIAVLQIRFADR